MITYSPYFAEEFQQELLILYFWGFPMKKTKTKNANNNNKVTFDQDHT